MSWKGNEHKPEERLERVKNLIHAPGIEQKMRELIKESIF